MTPLRRVLLCGKSLFISGLQMTLGTMPGIDLQIVEPQPDCILERIIQWKPDVMISETELFTNTFSLTLLKDFPTMKLIGLDLEDNHLVVFSGQASQDPTTSDLIQVIEGQDCSHLLPESEVS